MSPGSDFAGRLAALGQLRPELWKAELGAWLHNAGKLCPEFLAMNRGNDAFNYRIVGGSFALRTAEEMDRLRRDPSFKYLKRMSANQVSVTANLFAGILPTGYLNAETVTLPAPFNDRTYRISELIDFQQSPWYYRGEQRKLTERALIERFLGTSSRLTELLFVCHDRASNVEKEAELAEYIYRPKRNDPCLEDVYLSTVFGHEEPVYQSSFQQLWNEFGDTLEGRQECFADRGRFLRAAERAFPKWPADECPLNDVSIFDIGYSVAAFFKAAVAKCILEKKWPWETTGEMPADKRNDASLRWRIARVVVDGPSYYGRVERIPDLLVRKKLLDGMLKNVRQAIEEELWVANEVYRDGRGSCFLLPELNGEDDALLQAAFEKKAREAALRPVRIERLQTPESARVPGEEIGIGIWMGESDARGLGLGHAIAAGETTMSGPSSARLHGWWDRRGDVCPVCRLRPIGPGEKALKRKVCSECELRRENRSLRWLNEPESTIWIDEVADARGRFALVTGRLDLENWISGVEIEASLFTQRYKEQNGAIQPCNSPIAPKYPSFARIQRVLRNGKAFWESALDEIQQMNSRGPRLELRTAGNTVSVGNGHSVYLRFDNGPVVSVVQRSPGVFVTAENLERSALLAGWTHDGEAAAFLAGKLSGGAKIEEPTGYGAPNRLRETLTVLEPKPLEGRYAPVIRVLMEPREAMFLVPADQAIQAAEIIRNEYETQMGKVRNRLALHLSIVFTRSGTPMASILDGARRMQERRVPTETWEIESIVHDNTRIRFMTPKSSVAWNIASRMGAGERDLWYSYYRLTHPQRSEPELVHLLEAGQRTTITPATFDFEFLDSAGGRFEIAYDRGVRTGELRGGRPLYLDRLKDFSQAWNTLNTGLERSQIQQIGGLLREKHLFWGDEGHKEWIRFAVAALKDAAWKKDRRPAEFDTLKEWAASGLLLDVIELYLHIVRTGKGKG